MKKGSNFNWKDWDFYFSGIAMLIMTFIVAINAIARYLFNHPFVQVEEIATSMFVWLIFIGSIACFRNRQHIGIDCFVNMLPVKLRQIINTLVDILLMATNILMAYLSAIITVSAWSKLTPSMRIPYSFIDVAALIGFGVMVIHSVRFIVQDVIEVFNLKNSEEPLTK